MLGPSASNSTVERVLDDILMPARVASTMSSDARLIIGLIPVAIPPPLKLRVGALWRKQALTRSLADGADPSSDDRLALRARTLTSARERNAIACGIDNVVAAAEEPHYHWSSSAPFSGRAVIDSRKELNELAATLRASAAVRPRGVAQAELLLTDYDSPLYTALEGQPLRDAARAATAALIAGWAPRRYRQVESDLTES
jgi:hypothetical protein